MGLRKELRERREEVEGSQAFVTCERMWTASICKLLERAAEEVIALSFQLQKLLSNLEQTADN